MSDANELRVFHVWDGAPDLLEDERDGALLVAHDLREAIALWIRLVPSDVDCGEQCDPDDFDRDEELCVHCRGER